MTSHSPASGHNWAAYYQAVAGRPPRDTLLRALDRFESLPNFHPGLAVDLGCGDGRDTVELLRRGWRVLAIDGERQAFDRLLSRPIPCDRLQTQQMRFEALVLPAGVDLVNASFCLPFCLPSHFPMLWRTIGAALNEGGRFCGQLFGDRDSWADDSHRSHHTRQQVDALLEPFEIEWLDEEEHPGVTALGAEKHWHIFHIVARKSG